MSEHASAVVVPRLSHGTAATEAPAAVDVVTAQVVMGRRTRAVRGRRLVSLPKSAESTQSNTRLSLVSALPALAGGMRAIDDEVDVRSAGKAKT